MNSKKRKMSEDVGSERRNPPHVGGSAIILIIANEAKLIISLQPESNRDPYDEFFASAIQHALVEKAESKPIWDTSCRIGAAFE